MNVVFKRDWWVIFFCSVLCMTSCVNIPSSSHPHSLGSIPAADTPTFNKHASASPEGTVTKFIAATAYPDHDFARARAFLTRAENADWRRSNDTILIDETTVKSSALSGGNTLVTVTTKKVGTVTAEGVFRHDSMPLFLNFLVVRGHKGWLISSMPPKIGIVVDKQEFLRSHFLDPVYFFNQQHSLTSQPLWLYGSFEERSRFLIHLLLSGKQGNNKLLRRSFLRKKINIFFSQEKAILHIKIYGVTDTTEHDDQDLAQEIVATLCKLSTIKLFTISISGVPILYQGHRVWKSEFLGHSFVSCVNKEHIPQYFLSRHHLIPTVADRGHDRKFSSFSDVQSAALQGRYQLLAVVKEKPLQLYVGVRGTQLMPIHFGVPVHSIGVPVWDSSGLRAWILVNGEFVYCLTINLDGSVVNPAPPEKVALASSIKISTGDIQQLRISPDGQSVVFLYKHQLYEGSIRYEENTPSFIDIVPLTSVLVNPTATITWFNDTTLLIARSESQPKLQILSRDGLYVKELEIPVIEPPIYGLISICPNVVGVVEAHQTWLLRNDGGKIQWQNIAQEYDDQKNVYPKVPVFAQ